MDIGGVHLTPLPGSESSDIGGYYVLAESFIIIRAFKKYDYNIC